jgi:hypothetical protein
MAQTLVVNSSGIASVRSQERLVKTAARMEVVGTLWLAGFHVV